jgi:hypothetical protein
MNYFKKTRIKPIQLNIFRILMRRKVRDAHRFRAPMSYSGRLRFFEVQYPVNACSQLFNGNNGNRLIITVTRALSSQITISNRYRI